MSREKKIDEIRRTQEIDEAFDPYGRSALHVENVRVLLDEIDRLRQDREIILEQSIRELKAADRNWKEKSAEARVLHAKLQTCEDGLETIRQELNKLRNLWEGSPE